jgi:hypothetical protein
MSDTKKNDVIGTPGRENIPTQSAEFKNAVAEAVKEALSHLVPKVANTATTEDAESLMGALALQIARLSDQGMPEERKRIDPAEMERRQRAREAMGAAIMEVRARKYKPQYRATNKSVLNETMINPYFRGEGGKMIPVTFGWDGEPNDCMYPLCDEAKKIYKLFKESRGNYVGAPIPKTSAWATSNGLIINGAGPRSQGEIEVPHYSPDNTSERFSEGLDLMLPNDPNAKEVNILGTLAKPAIQNAIGEERRM